MQNKNSFVKNSSFTKIVVQTWTCLETIAKNLHYGAVHLKKQLKKSILRVDIFALLFINEPLATLKKVTEGCHFALHLQMNVWQP